MIEFVELRLYSDSSGSSYELLPLYSALNFDVKYNEVGAIEFDYPLVEAKALGLKDQSLVGAVCGFSDGTSREVEQFIVEGSDDDKVLDGTRMLKVNGRSTLGTYMEDPLVYPSNWPVASPTGHEFVNATVGTIMRTLIQRAKGRGCFPFLIETSFSGTTDSAGTTWGAQHTQNYATGTSYLQLLKDFMDLGYVDAYMSGVNLNLLNGGARGKHVGIGTVELRPAHNVSEMTTTTKSVESVSTVLMEGEEGTAVERSNATFQTTLGRRRERYVQQGGIADSGVLTLLADAELNLYARIPTEETLGVSNVGLTPFLDFDIADWVWVRYDTDQDAVERRVRQIAVAVDENGGVTLGLTLNSILYEDDVALQRRMDQYAGKGGSYGSTPNTQIDTTTPREPTTVGITPGIYWDQTTRTYVGAFVVNWNAPTLNVDGTALSDLDHYEVQWRYKGDTAWSAVMRTPGTETTFGYSPVTLGRTLQVRARAVDKSVNASIWSVTAEQVVPSDGTPPPKPSTPGGNSWLGTLRASWDGKDSTGAAMPVDFWYVSVHLGASATYTPDATNRVATMDRATNVIAATSLPYNTTQYIRLIAYDVSGNASPPSDAFAVTILPLVDVSNFPDDAMQTLYARTGKFIKVTADMMQANSVATMALQAGSVAADRLSIGARGISILPNSNMEDLALDGSGNPTTVPSNWSAVYNNGTAITLGSETTTPIAGTRSLKATFGTDTTPTIGNSLLFPVTAGQKWYIRGTARFSGGVPAGKQVLLRFHTAKPPSLPYNLFDSNALWQQVAKVGVIAADTSFDIEGTFTVPAGHTKGAVSVSFDPLGYAGTAVFDNIECWPATTDAQITDIGPGKISTGVLQASTKITAGNPNGARVDVGGFGIEGYTGANVKTFDLDSATGALWMSGTFTTEALGGATRVVIGSMNNPYQGNTSWNTIQFFSQNASWDPALIWTAYGDASSTVADPSWGVLQLVSPKLGTRNPAQITLRSEEESNNTSLTLSANTIYGTANAYVWGDANGTAVVHKIGYAGTDGSQTMSFRSTGDRRLEFRFGSVGLTELYCADENNNRQRLDILAKEVRIDPSVATGILECSGATNQGNQISWRRNSTNAALVFSGGSPGPLRAMSWDGAVHISISASAFNVASDARFKSNLRKTRETDHAIPMKRKDARVDKPAGKMTVLEKVKALGVYDYETPQGQSQKTSHKPPEQGYTQRGLLAQEVAEFWPEAVQDDDVDGSGMGVDLYYLLSTLWAAVQDLSDEVSELKGSA